MSKKLILGAAFAALLTGGVAHATTITNNEATQQTITVFSADAEKSFTLSPKDEVSLDQMCPQTCIIALQDGGEFEFANGEDLTLEDGGVYLAEPVQGSNSGEKPVSQ